MKSASDSLWCTVIVTIITRLLFVPIPLCACTVVVAIYDYKAQYPVNGTVLILVSMLILIHICACVA